MICLTSVPSRSLRGESHFSDQGHPMLARGRLPSARCAAYAQSLNLAGVKQLHFPREGSPGGASALGKNLGDVFEVLGTRPIALKFSCHPQPSDRLGARRYEATDGHSVCLHRHAGRRIRNDIDVVPLAHRLDCRHRQAHLRPEGGEYNLSPTRLLYSFNNTLVLPGVDIGAVDRLLIWKDVLNALE